MFNEVDKRVGADIGTFPTQFCVFIYNSNSHTDRLTIDSRFSGLGRLLLPADRISEAIQWKL